MSTSDILKIEQENRKDNISLIYLFKEGNFYHAYNWSAWLIHEIICCRYTNNNLKVSKKYVNKKDTFLFVGFPLSSLDKYIPKEYTKEFTPINDYQLDITIELPDDIKELTIDDLTETVNKWYNSFTINKSKKISPFKVVYELISSKLKIDKLSLIFNIMFNSFYTCIPYSRTKISSCP